jgi:uncharacterized membrane protein
VRGPLRTWLPFVAAALAMGATFLVGSVMTWVLMLVAVVFLMDGATLLWSRNGAGMDQHRQ